MGLNQVGSGCLTRASISERPSLTSNKGESTFEIHLEIYLLNWSKMYAWDKERTTRLQQGIMLYNIWGEKLATFSRKNAVLLDFVQMRWGEGPAQIFCHLFKSAFLVNKWSLCPTKGPSFELLTVFIGPESDHWECLSLTHSLTDSLPFSKLDWCDPGMWRWQLKTCWSCFSRLIFKKEKKKPEHYH